MDALLERLIPARTRNIGTLEVGRVLPVAGRRSVGPFVFLDHMGPHAVAHGDNADVPPHPHIGLCTVTLLLEGALVHRDSVGSVQTIRPGDLNWMTAGRGVVHSERLPPRAPGTSLTLEGLQIWVALPRAFEEVEASFAHHPAATLPTVKLDGGVTARLLVGDALGQHSPVRTYSRTLYLDVALKEGQTVDLPPLEQELAVYVVKGQADVHGENVPMRTMAVMTPGAGLRLRATQDCRAVILGGEPLDGPRFMWWNFVGSSRELVEEAKQRWREQRFDRIDGETEFVPLPEGPG